MIIERALYFIQQQLDLYLKQKMVDNEGENKVVLSGLLKPGGQMEVKQDQLALTLVNIEEERIAESQQPYRTSENGSHQKTNPAIKLNLFLLFAAHFKNYDEALKTISHVVSFFQARNVFERSKFPSMDDSLEKLILELQTMDFEQMNHLWGALGAKYMPSVLYKMRMLTVSEEEIQADVLPIKQINIEGK